MKKTVIFAAALSSLAGCVAPIPVATNAAGQRIRFEYPLLSQDELANNPTYVLLEKSIADGKYHVVNISKQRQPIRNTREERVVFNADLTRYAPDYEDRNFQTYTDAGNYQQQTVVYACDAQHQMIANQELATYTACNSSFAALFVPMGVEKAGAAGRISNQIYDAWHNASQNRMRIISDPARALHEAGVFENIAQLQNAK